MRRGRRWRAERGRTSRSPFYNDDLALVRDTREFDVASGESVVRFEDVAARIDRRP
jgi:hypothetical protein